MVLFSLALFASCEKNDRRNRPMDPDGMTKVVKSPLIEMAEYPSPAPCNESVIDLIAGQYKYAGSVAVSVSGEYLFVEYRAFGDCEITEAHLFVGNSESVIPSTRSGNPKIGHFPYFWDEGGSETLVTFSIPLGDLDLDDDECIKIAAHAVVICDGVEETAWARGSELVFAMKAYFNTIVDSPTEELRGMTADEFFTGDNWRDHIWYYPLADALNNPIDLLSIFDASEMGTAEVVPDGEGGHNLVITAPTGEEVYKVQLYIGPAEAFDQDYSQWDELDFWNNPVNPLEVPVSVSDMLDAQGFDGSRWGWSVEYCPGDCDQNP